MIRKDRRIFWRRHLADCSHWVLSSKVSKPLHWAASWIRNRWCNPAYSWQPIGWVIIPFYVMGWKSTSTFQPLPTSQTKVHRRNRSKDKHNTCPSHKCLVKFRAVEWILQPVVLRQISALLIYFSFHIVRILWRKLHSKSNNFLTSARNDQVSGPHSRSGARTVVKTRPITDSRLWRRRHSCLKFVSTNQAFCACDDILPCIQTPGNLY